MLLQLGRLFLSIVWFGRARFGRTRCIGSCCWEPSCISEANSNSSSSGISVSRAAWALVFFNVISGQLCRVIWCYKCLEWENRGQARNLTIAFKKTFNSRHWRGFPSSARLWIKNARLLLSGDVVVVSWCLILSHASPPVLHPVLYIDRISGYELVSVSVCTSPIFLSFFVGLGMCRVHWDALMKETLHQPKLQK